MLQAIKESKKAEGVGTYPRRRVPPAAEYAGRTILDTPHPRADASSFSGGFVSSELLQVHARQRLDSALHGSNGLYLCVVLQVQLALQVQLYSCTAYL